MAGNFDTCVRMNGEILVTTKGQRRNLENRIVCNSSILCLGLYARGNIQIKSYRKPRVKYDCFLITRIKHTFKF